jgi:hypothetical protein
MNWITLEGGAEVFIEESKGGICKSCGTRFVWGVTRNNKFIPVTKTPEGKWISHFADCPGAGKHRKQPEGELKIVKAKKEGAV